MVRVMGLLLELLPVFRSIRVLGAVHYHPGQLAFCSIPAGEKRKQLGDVEVDERLANAL
jgi:hypothetical protein